MSGVFLTTNYPLDWALRDWIAGTAPGHHLWGTPQLEAAGYDVHVHPYRKPRARSRVRTALRTRVGAPHAQLAARSLDQDTILYTADRDTLAGWGWLRRAGLTRRPIVAVINPSVLGGWTRRGPLLGYDVAVAISRRVHADLLALGRDPRRTPLIGWGPDLDFVGYQDTTDEFVVSSGKTVRDIDTLLAALHGVTAPARVHVSAPRAEPVPGHIEVRPAAPYAEVLSDLRRASVVAIPLTTDAGTAGLTELNDALAMGKPVVMTRNSYIDVDIEAVGCGIWVDRGDVRGWRDALSRLAADPRRRADMGSRGREFAAQAWNAQRYGDGVVEAFGAISG